MKKYLLILALTMMSVVSYGQDSTSVNDEKKSFLIEQVTDSDVEKLTDKYILAFENKLGELYNGPVKDYYAVTKEYIEKSALVWIITSSSVIGLFILFLIWNFIGVSYRNEETVNFICYVLGFFSLIIALPVLIINLIDYNASSYVAIKQIIVDAKGLM